MLPDWAVPGAQVICIKSTPWFGRAIDGIHRLPPRPGDVLPVFMQQYTIRDVFTGPTDAVLIHLVEIVNRPNLAGHEPGFPLSKFRPLEKLTDEIEQKQEEPV